MKQRRLLFHIYTYINVDFRACVNIHVQFLSLSSRQLRLVYSSKQKCQNRVLSFSRLNRSSSFSSVIFFHYYVLICLSFSFSPIACVIIFYVCIYAFLFPFIRLYVYCRDTYTHKHTFIHV